MSETTLIVVGVVQWLIGFGTATLYFEARKTRAVSKAEEERDALWDRLHGLKPCRDRNSNVCVAEGCYGEACITPAVSAQFATAPKSDRVVRHRTRDLRNAMAALPDRGVCQSCHAPLPSDVRERNVVTWCADCFAEIEADLS